MSDLEAEFEKLNAALAQDKYKEFTRMTFDSYFEYILYVGNLAKSTNQKQYFNEK